VFMLDDPRRFPALPMSLPKTDRAVVDRYVATAGDLAESGILNAVGSDTSVRINDHSGAEEIIGRFHGKDVQIGFTGLLRHCDADREKASFARVYEIIEGAAQDSQDSERFVRLGQLRSWRDAIEQLHDRSLNQLVRDRLVRDSDAGVLDFQEAHSPRELIQTYRYGDLLHWGRERPRLEAWETDDVAAVERRVAFLSAAAGLAHAYIGFGELARAAIGAHA